MLDFRYFVALVCTMGSFAHTRARAEEPAADTDAAVTATARKLAIEGVKLAQNGQCPEAIDKLERAEKLHHAPIVLTRLGECYIRVGRLLAGVESLRAVLREALPENPSPALSQAYEDAQHTLDETAPKLAHLTIRVQGAGSDADLSLVIDGRGLPAALLGASQPSDPGAHVIELSADGYLPATRRVTLAEGEDQTLVMSLEPAPQRARKPALAILPAPAPAHATLQPPSASEAAVAADGGSHWPAYVAWGTGAAALGVGIGFGIAAMNNKTSLDDRCPDHACPPGSDALLSTSRTNALVSTVGYVVAGGGAVVGLLLYWLVDGGAPHAADRRVRADHRGVAVRF